MGFFGKLFGRKKPANQAAPSKKPATPPPPAPTDPIRAYDAYGREMLIPREQWRTNVLPASIQKAWNDAENLYSILLSALRDGFRADVLDAVQHLYSIDPNFSRAACLWGVVLLEEGRLKEAEKIFGDYLRARGENGWILLNMAKVYSARHDETRAQTTLWRALEVDPNMDNAIGWFHSRHKEAGGEKAGIEAWQKIAQIPGSWRAQLWLARGSLDKGDLAAALATYKEALAHAGKPVPEELLTQMSGDLGRHNHLPESIAMTERYFDAPTHGVTVGNNLIKAHLDLEQVPEAQIILDQLYALSRPDWKETLAFWDMELAKARIKDVNVAQDEPLKMEMIAINGPIWNPEPSLGQRLFPPPVADLPLICFLGSSYEKPDMPATVQLQMSDAIGRLSRAIPLFLAEQVEQGTLARVQTLIPWINHRTGGFMVSGKPWPDEDAAGWAGQGESKGDHVVTTHIVSSQEPWRIDLHLIRRIDGRRLGRLSTAFDYKQPEGISKLGEMLRALLAEHGVAEKRDFPELYSVPRGLEFPYYLLRLEQLLAVRCAARSEEYSGFLNGEREIIDGNLQLCLACPKNCNARLLLVQTLLHMRKVNRSAVLECNDRIRLLQQEMPLDGAANEIVRQMLEEALAS